ncbi:ATP-binding protein [Candidatus Poribacteria bacterium]|nr:ATP-binding protein [Candidatus Poribacteria bacterium]
MKFPAFETIAKPHRDILRGIFTADTYAAKLGQVVKKEGPLEYRNAHQFFDKTHETEGLKVLLSGVEGRLKGRDRKNQDPIIQLQTPFGGGKTHTLIALYHKSKDWNVTPIVIVGSEIDASETFWGQIELQLNGKILEFDGNVAPGSNRIYKLFNNNKTPVLILMDEVLHYLTRATGISVEKSTLADQTIAFILSLTEAVTNSQNVAFIVTLQESEILPLANQFPLFNDLLNRMKRMVTPVEDTEISSIIRRRLFAKDKFDHTEAKKVVIEFSKYAKKEGILPVGIQESEYRDMFLDSYPFQPEVIDVLYKRWGSYPDFQRTRGVLRLLSRVVHCACGKNRPYITLADFDLGDSDIREDLLQHTGPEYRGIIANDITGPNAGAKVVNKTLGGTYENLLLGSRTATAIFLYSFTGGIERGATLEEIKRSAAIPEKTSAIIDTAKNQLSDHLFYLRTENGKLYFDTQPNLKRILQTRMENVDNQLVENRVNSTLQNFFNSSSYRHLKTYISPKVVSDIQDNLDLKLIVLPKRDEETCQNIIERKGETPRIYRNTLIFITPYSGEANTLKEAVKKVISYEEIEKDNSLNLSTNQKKEIAEARKQTETDLNNALRQDYRTVLIPTRDGLGEEDLGIPALGMTSSLAETIYEMLRVKGKILTSIGPRNISIRYLKENDSLSTSLLLHSSLRTPGESIVLRDAWINGICKGVEEGVFSLGEKVEGNLIPLFFKTMPTEITFNENEVIIRPDQIREVITAEDILHDYMKDNITVSTSIPFQSNSQSTNGMYPLLPNWKSAIQHGVKTGLFGIGNKTDDNITLNAFMKEYQSITFAETEVLIQPSECTRLIGDPTDADQEVEPEPKPPEPEPKPPEPEPVRKTIDIRFRLPEGKVSNVAQQINQLQSNFKNMKLELNASEGEITQDAYEELKERFRTIGIEIEEV